MLNPALLGQPGTTITFTPADVDDDGKPWPNTTLIPADSAFTEFWEAWVRGIKRQAFNEGSMATFQQIAEHRSTHIEDITVGNPYA